MRRRSLGQAIALTLVILLVMLFLVYSEHLGPIVGLWMSGVIRIHERRLETRVRNLELQVTEMSSYIDTLEAHNEQLEDSARQLAKECPEAIKKTEFVTFWVPMTIVAVVVFALAVRSPEIGDRIRGKIGSSRTTARRFKL